MRIVYIILFSGLLIFGIHNITRNGEDYYEISKLVGNGY